MVHGLPKFPASTVTCVDCLNGKQTRNSIPKQCSSRSTQPVELVHSDICGPISPISNSGKRYFLSFIDDYSRKAWAYLLAEKSDTLNCFKIFKSMVEKEAGMMLKCLRTDRGGEYTSTNFVHFCEENEIRRQLTNAYTPPTKWRCGEKKQDSHEYGASITISKRNSKIILARSSRLDFPCSQPLPHLGS